MNLGNVQGALGYGPEDNGAWERSTFSSVKARRQLAAVHSDREQSVLCRLP